MESLSDIFSFLLENLRLKWEDSGISIIIFLLGVLGTMLLMMWKALILMRRKVNQLKLDKNLHPYFSKKEVREATRFFIETRCQNLPPSNSNEPSQTHAFATSQKLIPFFMKSAFDLKKENDQRFYLILADSGMGKTTFMMNLFLTYTRKYWLSPENKIKLLPLGHFNSFKEIKTTKDEEKEKTILLLDAFDEDINAAEDYEKRLSEILEAVWRYKEVVVTCRTQFFPSQTEEPHKTGLLKLGGNKGEHLFHKLYLTPFSNSDVRKYIRKKFSLLQFSKRMRAYRVVKKCPNLMVRPMLLNYIEEIIAPEIRIVDYKVNFNLIPFTKLLSLDYNFSVKTRSSSTEKFDKLYQIYKALIQKWIEREGNRRTERREEFMEELHLFSREIALNMYEMRDERGGYFIHRDEISEFAIKHNINLEELEMRSRSLLNRNSEGFYKFSHKSIMEYFLAREAIENKEYKERLDRSGLDVLVQLLDEQLEMDWLLKNKVKTMGSFRTAYMDAETSYSRNRGLSLITSRDIGELSFLNIENYYIPSVNFLTHSTKIRKLILRGCQLKNCSPIVNLVELEYLDLSKNRLSECDMVRKLTSLESLILSYNQIHSGEPIAGLVNLRLLYVHNNELQNCTFLKKLENLHSLALIYNRITDFSPVMSLRNLKHVYLPKSIEPSQLKAIKSKLPSCYISLV